MQPSKANDGGPEKLIGLDYQCECGKLHRIEVRHVSVGRDILRTIPQTLRALGLTGSVVFAGFHADLASFIGRLDVLAHAALEEGLGLALLEAQAAGVPVVAFRAGGVAEIVADGRTGYLVRSADTAAFAIALGELLQNEARRKAFRQRAATA